MEDIGDYLYSRVQEGFRKESDPYGKKWSPLSPATVSRKRKLGQSLRILVATDKMRQSLRVDVGRKSVKLVMDFPSEFHQSGTRKMPKRQILPDGKLSTKDERAIKDIVVEYLDI